MLLLLSFNLESLESAYLYIFTIYSRLSYAQFLNIESEMIILQNTLQKTAILFFFQFAGVICPCHFFKFLIVIPVHITRLWTKILCDLLFYHQNEESFAAVCLRYLFLRNSTWDTGTYIFFLRWNCLFSKVWLSIFFERVYFTHVLFYRLTTTISDNRYLEGNDL